MLKANLDPASANDPPLRYFSQRLGPPLLSVEMPALICAGYAALERAVQKVWCADAGRLLLLLAEGDSCDKVHHQLRTEYSFAKAVGPNV